jgi:hypothetical protein
MTESRCPTCGGEAGKPALSRGESSPGVPRSPCLWLGHGRKPPMARERARESAKRALAVALAASTDEEIREAVARELARRRQSA